MVPSKRATSGGYIDGFSFGEGSGTGDGSATGGSAVWGVASGSGVASSVTVSSIWLGPVPLMNSSVRFSVSPGTEGSPVFGFISTCAKPGGISQSPSHSGCSVNATCIKSDQIGSAEFAPVKPNCEPSSKPTQTAQTRLGVNPANQPSREVPVLPATFAFKPRARTFAAR